MSDKPILEDLEQYVDWISLEYYDKRIKEYIDACCTEDLKIGGNKHSSWFEETPSSDNLNRLYRVLDSFQTGHNFEEAGVTCGAGSVVYLDNTQAGLKYKLLVNIPVIDSSVENSIEKLDSTVKQLTDRVEQAQENVENRLMELNTSVTNLTSDVSSLEQLVPQIQGTLEDTTRALDRHITIVDSDLTNIKKDLSELLDDVEDAETQITQVRNDLRATEHSIHDQLHSHEQRLNTIDGEFVTKIELQSVVKDVESKLDSIPSIDSSTYATNESVDKKIADLVGSAPSRLNTLDELASALEEHEDAFDVLTDVIQNKINKSDLATVATTGSYKDLKDTPDTSDFATKEFVQTVIEAIPEVDLTGYAKTEDIPDTSVFLTEIPEQYVTDAELAAKGYLTEHQSLEGYAKSATVVKQKYEVLPIDGMFVLYGDKEIRLNTQRVVPVKQTVGATGNPNMFYATFRAYAPEDATHVVESVGSVTDEEPSVLQVDSYGRKYAVIWSAIASFDGTSWSLYGDKSTVDKYLGFYYTFTWLKADTVIGVDKVRVILTNDACHTDLVPDAVARRIEEKITQIDIPTVPTKVSELENDAGYLTEHQSLEGLATQDFVKEQIANAQLSGGDGGTVDLSYLATKNELVETEERILTVIAINDSIQYGTF